MKNEQIKMKRTSSQSNPAFNNVVSENEDTFNCYLRRISKCKTLTTKEEQEVAKKAFEGDFEAKKELVEANLKLVITIAKKAIHIAKIPMTDLIQEGNLGLMIAAEKFNYKLGYKFSTYASWWIKQSMFKGISEQAHCMKIPVYIQETLSKFSKIKAEMERKYNCQVKNADVAKEMDISEQKIENYLNAYTQTISIEGYINDDSDMCVADILEDKNTNVFANAESENLKTDLETVMSVLKKREQDVVKMRFGLDNIAKKTLEEIGNLYGVTKECIRQTELRALKKMRNSAMGQELLTCYIQ